jgi:lipoprotein-anchoring transpeptidase ErfK/SrfK
MAIQIYTSSLRNLKLRNLKLRNLQLSRLLPGLFLCLTCTALMPPNSQLAFSQPVPKSPSESLDQALPDNAKEGQATITRLEVNLTKRQVVAYQDRQKLKTYRVAVGRAGWETPPGNYRVRQMIENPAWKNPFTGDVIAANNSENPLGKHWIGFWTNGKNWSGFHGTSKRDSVGQAVSHGCLRMYPEDIKELFSKISLETTVKVTR